MFRQKSLLFVATLFFAFQAQANTIQGVITQLLPAGEHEGQNCQVMMSTQGQLDFAITVMDENDMSMMMSGMGMRVEDMKRDPAAKTLEITFVRDDFGSKETTILSINGKTVRLQVQDEFMGNSDATCTIQ